MQIVSALLGCRTTALACNVLPNGKNRADAYGLVAEKMTDLSDGTLRFTRDHLKKSSMIDGYGAGRKLVTKQMEEDMGELFNEAAVDIFYDAQLEIAPAAAVCKVLFQELWDNKRTEFSWTLPDGFIVVHKPMEARKITFSLANGQVDIEGTISLNLATNKNTSLGVSVIHSIDAYIARQMVLRCDFDIYTIHDGFNCHPNNAWIMRNTYKEIIGEIVDSRLLEDIISELTGSTMATIPKEFTSKEMTGDYTIC